MEPRHTNAIWAVQGHQRGSGRDRDIAKPSHVLDRLRCYYILCTSEWMMSCGGIWMKRNSRFHHGAAAPPRPSFLLWSTTNSSGNISIMWILFLSAGSAKKKTKQIHNATVSFSRRRFFLLRLLLFIATSLGWVWARAQHFLGDAAIKWARMLHFNDELR